MKTRYTNNASEDGFTLLELVISVSLTLILGASGFLGVNKVADNAREASVERAAYDAIAVVLASDNSTSSSNFKSLQEIQDEYNDGSEEVTLEIVEDDQRNITITARGWDNRFVAAKHIDSNGKITDYEHSDSPSPEDEPTPPPVIEDETAEPIDPPEFLENPEEFERPEEDIIEKKEQARYFAQQVMERGILYEDIYTPENHESDLGADWMISIGATEDGMYMIDKYWGAFTIASDPIINYDGFMMQFVLVITAEDEAYYLLREGYTPTQREMNYFAYFDAEQF